MAGKTKFDQEAAFKSILGGDREPGTAEKQGSKGAGKNRVQRAYFLDRDVDKALRRKALEEEKSLTESINEALRSALKEYI